MDPIAQLLAALLAATGSLSLLAIMAAGFALMLGLKHLFKRLLLFGIFLIVVGTLGPGWLP